jgi:hypothetical protein
MPTIPNTIHMDAAHLVEGQHILRILDDRPVTLTVKAVTVLDSVVQLEAEQRDGDTICDTTALVDLHAPVVVLDGCTPADVHHAYAHQAKRNVTPTGIQELWGDWVGDPDTSALHPFQQARYADALGIVGDIDVATPCRISRRRIDLALTAARTKGNPDHPCLLGVRGPVRHERDPGLRRAS